MNDNCEFIDQCPIFRYFNRVAQLLYRKAYCQNEYESCARHIRYVADQPVPDYLMPQGHHLWSEDAPPAPTQSPGA